MIIYEVRHGKKSQFGFRKSYNTSNAVLKFICDAGNCLENNSYLMAVFSEAIDFIIAVFVDFSKAIDCDCHEVLVVVRWKKNETI